MASKMLRRKRHILLAAAVLVLGSFVMRQLLQPLPSSSSWSNPSAPISSITPLSSLAASTRDGDNHIKNDIEAWGPEKYLKLARTGPRRCVTANCYIVDIVADPYQPRIFLSMLGLPATDIDRKQRGSTTNVSFVDVRTREWTVMEHSRSLTNRTHGFALLLQGISEGNYAKNNETSTVVSPCFILNHMGGTALGAFWESMTYYCLLLPNVRNMNGYDEHSLNVRVDVLLAPKDWAMTGGAGEMPHYLNLNGPDRPFYISNKQDGAYSSSITPGLFNSVSRRGSVAPEPFAWRRDASDGNQEGSNDGIQQKAQNDSNTQKKLRMSACIIGVDYVSVQQREVVQYYITSGFDHVYLGVPQWPTSELFNKTFRLLRDFVNDGKLSIIVSEYAGEFIEKERFGKNFTYAPSGHKSSYLNTCILVARAAGDDFVFVGDFDELIEHNYGNKTSVAEAVEDQLSLLNISARDSCAVNLGSVSGVYHRERAGFADTGKILDKLAGVSIGYDSVAKYGKTILNAKRILRAGLHGAAYCESHPGPTYPRNSTRPSVKLQTNQFRPDEDVLRTLHLRDSYHNRSLQVDLNLAKKGKLQSYYARDWANLVYSELDRRAETSDIL